jgi:hypothetical protein
MQLNFECADGGVKIGAGSDRYVKLILRLTEVQLIRSEIS